MDAIKAHEYASQLPCQPYALRVVPEFDRSLLGLQISSVERLRLASVCGYGQIGEIRRHDECWISTVREILIASVSVSTCTSFSSLSCGTDSLLYLCAQAGYDFICTVEGLGTRDFGTY